MNLHNVINNFSINIERNFGNAKKYLRGIVRMRKINFWNYSQAEVIFSIYMHLKDYWLFEFWFSLEIL